MNSSAKSTWPRNIVVMGGGRWARVYIDVLLGLLPTGNKLLVYSPRNYKTMSDWVESRGTLSRVSVLSSLPSLPEHESKAVIVVNAAADHEKSIDWALSQQSAVLVEKPLTLSSGASSSLINEADRRGVYLAAAHVFLFAEYMVNFKKMTQSLDEIITIDVLWADAVVEARHGEVKSFDPGLRVFEDCIPHVLSVLETLNPGEVPQLVQLELLSGGAQLGIVLASSHFRYTVRLIRNGAARSRVIVVAGAENYFTLDFSQEPGTIVNGSETISAASNWASSQKPLSRMLEAFFDAVGGGLRDPRLGTAVGLRAACLSEEILPAYKAAQADWLSKRLLDAEENDEDLRYALREIALVSDPRSQQMTDEFLNQLIRDIKYCSQDAAGRDRLVLQSIDFVKSVLNKSRTN